MKGKEKEQSREKSRPTQQCPDMSELRLPTLNSPGPADPHANATKPPHLGAEKQRE